jgi:phosphatidylglycerophosphate synthase
MILTGVAMVLYYFGHQYSGVAIYLLAVFSDAADGMIARKCDLITAWGKMLDPLADKVICLPPMAFFANGGQLSVGLVIIFATIELIGQFGVRGILAYLKKDMAANDYGKVKTVTAFILIISVFVFQDVNINFIQNSAMLILCVLASCSVLFKIIPAKS